MATANASPRARSVGNPTTTVVTAPVAPAANKMSAMSQCQRVASVPATAPATPTNAI